MKQTMWKSKQMKIIAIQARLGSTKGHIFKYIYFLWDEKLKCKVYCLLLFLFFLTGWSSRNHNFNQMDHNSRRKMMRKISVR